MSDLHLAEGLIIHPLSLHPERAILRRFFLDFGVYTLQNPFTFIYYTILYTDILSRENNISIHSLVVIKAGEEARLTLLP